VIAVPAQPESYAESGQGFVEYGMILILVAVVVVLVVTLLGPAVGNLFSQVVDLF
jgi:pilus assembly protein Flp/PilA